MIALSATNINNFFGRERKSHRSKKEVGNEGS